VVVLAPGGFFDAGTVFADTTGIVFHPLLHGFPGSITTRRCDFISSGENPDLPGPKSERSPKS
jgi:hypothetical protein